MKLDSQCVRTHWIRGFMAFRRLWHVYAGRQDRVACLANLCQAVLATGQGRLAAAGEWVLNEKRLTERAGLDAIQDRLAQPGPDLGALVSDVRARLELSDDVWASG